MTPPDPRPIASPNRKTAMPSPGHTFCCSTAGFIACSAIVLLCSSGKWNMPNNGIERTTRRGCQREPGGTEGWPAQSLNSRGFGRWSNACNGLYFLFQPISCSSSYSYSFLFSFFFFFASKFDFVLASEGNALGKCWGKMLTGLRQFSAF